MESAQRRLAAVLAFAIAFPVVAQEDEGRVFFSLSSERTYAPAETPSVQLWGQGFSKLQFRLYRVNDPVAFFQKLENDHQFGGRAPRPPGEMTRLERIRAWKQRLRTRLRNTVRAQFTADSRADLRNWSLSRERQAIQPGPSNVQGYAAVPVLNPQQLVATWEQPFATANRWESARVPVPATAKGLYLVEATNGSIQAYTIVSITEIALIAKATTGRLMTRVVKRDTGAPLSDCPVTVFAHDKQTRYGEGKTDANGLLETAVKDEKPESALILARQGDDFAAISMYGGNLSSDPSERLAAYIYTDRPVYRPGHTVYYRGILRDRAARGYEVPPFKEVSVEITDEEGQPVHRERLPVSSLGTANGKFTIPAAAPLGHWSVQFHFGENTHSAGFEVEEYRKPEYEVRVTPAARRVLQGESIEAVIDARYFYGEPVANAKVTYVVHRSRYWFPYYRDESDDEGEDNQGEDSPFADREQVLEESGTLDADGKLTVRIPTQQAGHDLQYRIEGRVTDAAGREIPGTAFVTATVGRYMLHVQSTRYVYAPGDDAVFEVETRDYDGKPVPGIAYQLELSTHSWRQKGGTRVGAASGVTGPDGRARATLQVPRAGSYLAVASSATPQGRRIEDRDYVWVSGGGDWSGTRGERIEIIPDKKKYAAGETARVMIVAQPGAHLWVTVEGRTIHESKFVSAKGSAVTVDIPVDRAWAPNVYVNAVTIVGNQLMQGSKLLRVPPDEYKLAVELTPSKPQFKPGEPAVYTLLAKDAAGRPATGEFSVGVVDEAIYSVRPDSTPDIVSTFYGRQYARVSTESSLSYYFHGEAGKRRMQLAAIRPFRPRAQLKPDRMVQPKVRKAFPDTAFWSATVRTGADGRAQVRFDFPDALTTWRSTVRGITADTRVGAVLNKVIVRKDLLIRLSTPRFFRQGDTMTVTAIAQNFLPSEKKVRVSLEAKGLEIADGGTRELTVPSRGTGTVDYQVKVPASREAVLLAKALTDEESDALELTIPVQPFGVRISESRGGSLSGAAAEGGAEIVFPPDAEPSSRVLDLSVSPSAAGALFEALEFLTSFPYGCTEQTMSSFVPNIVVSQAVKGLGLKSRVDEASLKKQIRAGLDRLYRFQHDDGGWGWWETDDSAVFMTAYVVAGLAQAAEAGQDVDSERVSRGAEWLRQSPEVAKESQDLQAYAAYALALAGASDAPKLTALYQARSSLSSYALALVGLASRKLGDGRAAEIATLLESRAQSSDLETWWEAKKDTLMDLEVDATPEATAYALKFLAAQKPASPLLPKAALYLVNHRNQGYWWNSTKQTAMVIHGLTGFVAAGGELKPDFTATVTVNGKAVLTKKFTTADALTPATLRLDAAQLAAGANKVRVTRTGGSGRLYWSARGAFYSNAPGLARRGNRKLEIRREYFRLVPEQQSGKIVHRLQPLEGQVAQGDVLAVRLTIDGGGWRYLMIEDPIPAGAEAVERDDLYQFADKPDWWEYWFTRRELRDDRAVFFQTWSRDDTSRYFYLMKIVNPGQFRVSPARVEPMYQPEYFATTGGTQLEVRR